MRYASRREAIGILAASGMAVASGKSYAQTGGNAQRKSRVAYANVTDEIPFGVSVLNGMREAVAKRPQLGVTWMDNRNDPARAIEIARLVAAGDYDLFIDYNAQQSANGPISRMMKEASVKVLSIQTPMPNFPLFAVDNLRAGSESGRALAEAAKARWPSVAPVAVVIGSPELGPVFQERAAGAKKTLAAAYPDSQIVEFSSRNDAGNTRQLVFDTLTRFPESKLVIWVHIDAMALAALAAVRNAKREDDVLIAATGGDVAAYPEIRRPGSPFIGTYSFFPELWGEEIISLGERILKGEAVPARTSPSQADFVTAANYGKFYRG